MTYGSCLYAAVAALLFLAPINDSVAASSYFADDLDRLVLLRTQVRKDAAGLLAALKSLDGKPPSATVLQYLRSAKKRLDASVVEAESIIEEATKNGSLGQPMVEEVKLIRRSHALVEQFVWKYAPAALEEASPVVKTTEGMRLVPQAKRFVPTFDGTVRLQLGTSSFSGANDASSTAQNISLTGRYRMSPNSSFLINFDRNSAVKQTAYSSTRGRIGYNGSTASGARFNAHVGFSGYSDEVLVRSDHSDVNVGSSVLYPLGSSLSFSGDANFNQRSYKLDGGNDFSGVQVNGKLRLGSNKSLVDVAIRSRIQSSDIAFLNYTRLAPSVEFRSGSGRKYFSAKAEYETLSYDSEAMANNYTRARGELIWNTVQSRTQLSVTKKQFTNNEALSNIRVRASASSHSGASSVGHSVTFVYHTDAGDEVANYIDLRSDFSKNSRTTSFESHLFARGWLKKERIHRIDWSTSFGVRVWKLKVGPSGGVHMQIDPDNFEFKSDGTSWRLGAKAAGYFVIKKVTLSLNARYELTTAYNSQIVIDRTTGLVTRGEVETRHPTTLLVSGSARIPVRPDLDIKVDVRQYDIDLDLDSSLSVGPINKRSQTQILVGLVYRISR